MRLIYHIHRCGHIFGMKQRLRPLRPGKCISALHLEMWWLEKKEKEKDGVGWGGIFGLVILWKKDIIDSIFTQGYSDHLINFKSIGILGY